MSKKKQKPQVINDCNDCTNSFRVPKVDNFIYCSTKVQSRDSLSVSGRVGTATDCPYFRDKNKVRVWR